MKNFKHALVALTVAGALGVVSPVVEASNTSGSIYGKTTPNSTLTYKNKTTGVTRTVSVNDEGRFNISNVPPGTYTVTDSKGVTRDIIVRLGTGSNVNFDVEVISVSGARISAIDTTSVESTAVFSADEIDALPLPRNSVAVALLTPGAVQGGDNFGRNLPSFGGSSVAENGYYIDGFDVTNLRSLLQFANLPQDAIAQTQVKSGGYGVEYGRALGGIVNIVTKSGSNDWEFGGAVYYRPDSLRASPKDIYDLNTPDNAVSGFNSKDSVDSLEYNIYAGGPIIEDSLFFFVNLEGQDYKSENFNASGTSNISEVDTPNFLAKLDWYITSEHLLRLTAIDNTTEYDRVNYVGDSDNPLSGVHTDETSAYTYQEGGDILILNYTGYMTDNFTVNLMAGKLEHEYLKVPNLPGDDCAYAWDTLGDRGWAQRVAIGCWNAPVQALVTDQVADKDERTSYKADFEYTLNDHTIRFGYNHEQYDSTSPGVKYSGDIYYRYLSGNAANGGVVNQTDIGVGTDAVRIREYFTQTATFGVENTAWYIEDSWQVNDELLIYGGLRGETFKNTDGSGDTFLESDQLVAPRAGFSWDIDGDSTRKLFGTIGRYYIPVASNTNIRATRSEEFYQDFYLVDGYNPADGTPIGLGDKFGPSIVDVQVANPDKIADVNLSPMYQDEIIFGYQEAVSDEWTLSAKFMGRTIGDGMDDFCANDGFTRWAADNGYDNFDPHSLAGCIIINPGKDITIAMDLENDGNLVNTTTPAEYHGLPEYKRHYLGLEFKAEKAFSDRWSMNLSYVLSRSFGNVEGYVNSTLAQEDAGATQDFDHANFMDGSYGDLPNDRRHQLKAFGIYQLTDEVSMSMNFSAISGIPLNCNGYISTEGMLTGDGSTSYDYGNFIRYSPSSFYCNNEQGETVLTQRGDAGRANWTFNTDVGFRYQPEQIAGLSLEATIQNLFNTQRPTTFSQVSDVTRGSSQVNANYLKPTGYQTSRRVMLSAKYRF